MDATRRRRTHDALRQAWYAHWRCVRFARRLGFAAPPPLRLLVLAYVPRGPNSPPVCARVA
jgi:hypothetical protein